MTLPGYSIDDVDLQDTLLDAVEVAVDEIIAASRELIPFRLLSVSLRHRQRIYNTALVIHRVTVLELAPQSYLPHHHEIDGRRQVALGTTRTVLLGESERFPNSEPTSVADVDTALPQAKRLRIATFDYNRRRHRDLTDRWRLIEFTIGSLRG